MSEVDRLSNSGLYPALPIEDRRASKDSAEGAPRREKQPPGASTPPDSNHPRPPKSLIDEYA
jgi:hypothetical protein